MPLILSREINTAQQIFYDPLGKFKHHATLRSVENLCRMWWHTGLEYLSAAASACRWLWYKIHTVIHLCHGIDYGAWMSPVTGWHESNHSCGGAERFPLINGRIHIWVLLAEQARQIYRGNINWYVLYWLCLIFIDHSFNWLSDFQSL